MTQFSENGSGREAFIDGIVTDAAGQRASIVKTDHNEGDGTRAWIQMTDGRQVLIPANLLKRQADGSYHVPLEFESVLDHGESVQMSFPVMEEQLQVEKRLVETGRGIRIHKTIEERQQMIDEPLMRDELSVEHVAVGQIVPEGQVPEMRYEGETLVVPVLEEVIVVQKQLLLKEEVRITRRRQEVHEPQQVALRSEHIRIERFDDEEQAGSIPPDFRAQPHQPGPAAGNLQS
jgi:uncharacterized protein (TIGR02271 family)